MPPASLGYIFPRRGAAIEKPGAHQEGGNGVRPPGPGNSLKKCLPNFIWVIIFPQRPHLWLYFMKIGVRTIGDILFSRDHLWVRMDDDIRATLGMTDFLQEKMGEIYSLRLPEEGEELIKEESFGLLEAKNGRRELMAPISGEVIEINYEALEVPEIINDDPLSEGWLLKVEMPAGQEFDDLLTEEEYEDYLSEEEELEEE